MYQFSLCVVDPKQPPSHRFETVSEKSVINSTTQTEFRDETFGPLTLEDYRPHFKSRAFSVLRGFRPQPGATNIAPPPESSFLFGFVVEGARGNIASQIAVKLVAETAVSSVLSADESLSHSEIVQNAFKESNQRVFDYGQRMFAGGKMAASAIFFASDRNRISLVRVGAYDALLLRDGRLVRFFPENNLANDSIVKLRGAGMERFLGTNLHVLADVSSVTLKPDDAIVISTVPIPDQSMDRHVTELAMGVNVDSFLRTTLVAGVTPGLKPELVRLERNMIGFYYRFGVEPIELREVAD